MTAPYRASGLTSSALPARFASELLAELGPGERVLWTGLPQRAALVRRALGELLMPLAFNGFVLALVAMSSHQGGSLALGAAPLLALGLQLFRAPLGAWRALHTTFYAVTDRRALVFDADAIATIERSDIMSVRVRPRGRTTAGDIALVVKSPVAGGAGPALLGVRDAAAVAAMLRAA
jgi:hypothetical protein